MLCNFKNWNLAASILSGSSRGLGQAPEISGTQSSCGSRRNRRAKTFFKTVAGGPNPKEIDGLSRKVVFLNISIGFCLFVPESAHAQQSRHGHQG